MRTTRGITISNLCSICNLFPKNVIGCLRDCQYSYKIWECLAEGGSVKELCYEDLNPSLLKNLMHVRAYVNSDWNVTFGIPLYSFWRNRNEVGFSGTASSVGSIVTHVKALTFNVLRFRKATQVTQMPTQGQFYRVPSYWQSPEVGEFNLNCNAAVTSGGELACG